MLKLFVAMSPTTRKEYLRLSEAPEDEVLKKMFRGKEVEARFAALRTDGFDFTTYEAAHKDYRGLVPSSSAQTRKVRTARYVVEKRKVLAALGGSLGKQVVHEDPEPAAVCLEESVFGPVMATVPFRIRTKSKQAAASLCRQFVEGQSNAVKRPAGAVSDGTAAPARLTRFSTGAESAFKAMETHLSIFSLGDAEAGAILSRARSAEST